MDHNKQDKGFTLVELLIVIVILGILAGVTVFAVRGITQDANENSCAAEQRTIETAMEAFFADNNADPADIRVGMRVRPVFFDYPDDGVTMLRYEPA